MQPEAMEVHRRSFMCSYIYSYSYKCLTLIFSSFTVSNCTYSLDILHAEHNVQLGEMFAGADLQFVRAASFIKTVSPQKTQL